MRDIGRAVKVTDAAIYHHFRSKRDILDELLAADFRIGSGCDEPAPRAQSQLAPLIERIVDRAIESIDSNGDLLTIILREALAGDALALRRYREVLNAWERDVAAVIVGCNRSHPRAVKESQSLAREMVSIIAMAIEDAFLLRRDGAISSEERRRNLRRFLTSDLTVIATGGAECSPTAIGGHSPAG